MSVNLMYYTSQHLNLQYRSWNAITCITIFLGILGNWYSKRVMDALFMFSTCKGNFCTRKTNVLTEDFIKDMH